MSTPTPGTLEYEGKAKTLFATDNPNQVIQRFKNDVTAFNGLRKEQFEGKGAINNLFSTTFFEYLEQHGIKTHFIKRLNETDMLVKRLRIIPVETVARNVVSGSLQKRTGLEEGSKLPYPIVETYLKSDSLNDPMLADVHIELLKLVDAEGLAIIKKLALEINDLLITKYLEAGLQLVDIKFEFGYDVDGNILLGDEISPDGSRLWDLETNQKFDKDVFRKEIGDLMEAYREVAKRLGLAA